MEYCFYWCSVYWTY